MRYAPLQLDAEQFLARYWQREALCIRGGMPGFAPPADADELAGLAMEAGCDARIVHCDRGRWTQRRGPFDVDDFTHPGAWALLVQGVDHYWDDAAALFDTVSFLPRWRFDDVLMSYATAGGGAGPHYDNYDVFIIQGEGRRHWDLGQRCDPASPLQADSDMQILARFETRASYTLECGDVLYIPPGIAHRGTSEGESTSFSLGFRAPRLGDLLARWVDTRLQHLGDDCLYRDPARPPAAAPGQITAGDLDVAREQLLQLLTADDGRWFGEVLTETGAPAPPDGIDLARTSGPLLLAAAPGSRVAWSDTPEGLLLFAAGDTLPCTAALRPLIESVCSGREFVFCNDDARPAGSRSALQWLLDSGAVEVLEDG